VKAAPTDSLLASLLLLLTVVTGFVDAVSYLRLEHVFVANMTGNIVFLGFAAAGAGQLSVSASLGAIAAFLAGSFSGGRLGVRLRHNTRRLLAAATFAECILVGAAALIAHAAGPIEGGVMYALILPLGLAMGLQNAVAREIALPDLMTTVLTVTLTSIAADLPLRSANFARFRRRLAAVTAMLAGAVTGGALVLQQGVTPALTGAAVLLAGIAVAAAGRVRPL